MVRQWLSGSALEAFLRDDFGRAPRMGLATAWGAAPLLDWRVVAGLLSRGAAVRAGRCGSWYKGQPPRSMLEAHKLLRQGWSLLLLDADAHDEGLRRLAVAVNRDLPGDVSIQIAAHPAGQPGFGWRSDREHIFHIQSCGSKTLQYREEVEGPARAWRLSPGDWLYMPAGWPHRSLPEDDGLTLRVCVQPPRRLSKACAPRQKALTAS